MTATRRKRGPYRFSQSKFQRKASLLAANIEHLTGRRGFDLALAALMIELDRMARRPAYRPLIVLAARMLADRLDDVIADGFSDIPTAAMTPGLYVGIDPACGDSVGVSATLKDGHLTNIELLEDAP